MKEKLARIGLVALLAFPATAAVACDKEDQKDVEEAGNEADKQIDKLDSDGKDD